MKKLYKIICPYCGGEMESTPSIGIEYGFQTVGQGRCANPQCGKIINVVYDSKTDSMYADIPQPKTEQYEVVKESGTVIIREKRNIIS